MSSVGARYDAYADWYEEYVTTGAAGAHSQRVANLLGELLGVGDGRRCLDVCCGTGVRAQTLTAREWRPIGVDLSLGQLRHATGRLPVVAGDAANLPIRAGSFDAAVCVLSHTDVEDYAGVLREIARTLKPGGRFVHIGVHPCFCGAFADRTDLAWVVLSPGYRSPGCTTTADSFGVFSPQGVGIAATRPT